MVYSLCFLENVPKHCLKRIEAERSHHYGCRNYKNKQVYIFSHHGLLCASFVKHSGEIILTLKQRLAVQLKSRCQLRREQLMV